MGFATLRPYVCCVARISYRNLYDLSIEEMREADRNLTLMIQADMIAYHEPGEPMQLGLPEMYVSPRCVIACPNTQDDYEQHRYTRSYTTRC